MSTHSTYDTLRHIADSWGLLAMFVGFGVAALWVFRPGSREHHDEAANMIFKDESDGE